jgi:hypothetical protein
MRSCTNARIFALLLIGANALAAAPVHAQDPLHTSSAAMAAKIAKMRAAALHLRAPNAPPLRTAFTDQEMNAYLAVEGPSFLPPGIERPQFTAQSGGRITARAVVDLDTARPEQPRGLFNPLALVSGAVEVVATGSIAADNGRGTAHFESGTIAGIPVPRGVVEQLLRFYTRTPDRPQGFGLDSAFELPAGIRSVVVDAGRVTITQ